jgi:hypothetical protein
MAYDNAKRILREGEMRIASSAEGIYDEDLVIGFWDGIEAKYINECVRWLNHADNRIVYAPTSFYDVSFEDDLYHLHAYYSEKDQRIYRLLMRNAIQSSAYAQTTTKWKLLSGETYQSGTSTIVLSMSNVDPAYALAIESEALAESYTDEIYLITDVQLEGTWYSIKRDVQVSSETGLYEVRWVLSRYDSEETGFTYNTGNDETIIQIIKRDCSEDEKDRFFDDYRFDPSGDWYEEDPASPDTYIAKNGEAGTGAIPATAKTLSTSDPGRQARVQVALDEARRSWNIDAYVSFTAEDLRYSSRNNAQFIVSMTPRLTMKQDYGFGLSKSAMDLVADYYNTGETGTERKIQITRNQANTYDYIATEMITAGFQTSMKIGPTKFYSGYHYNLKPTTNDPPKSDEVLLAIDPKNEVSAQVFYNKEDDTWNWFIVEKLPKDEQLTGGTLPLAEFGEPLKIMRVWEYTGQTSIDHLGSGYSDVGYYNSDKEFVKIDYDIRVDRETLTYSYTRVETIYVAPSDADNPDGWYIVSWDAYPERDTRNMRMWSFLPTGQSWKMWDNTGTGSYGKMHLYYLSMGRWREIKILVRKNYFVRHPTKATLAALGLYDVMNAEVPGPTASKRKLTMKREGPYLYSITETIVTGGRWKRCDVDHILPGQYVLGTRTWSTGTGEGQLPNLGSDGMA